jgi:hypothetical protein
MPDQSELTAEELKSLHWYATAWPHCLSNNDIVSSFSVGDEEYHLSSSLLRKILDRYNETTLLSELVDWLLNTLANFQERTRSEMANELSLLTYRQELADLLKKIGELP